MKRIRSLSALAVLLLVAGTASASDLWLHVRVDEGGGAKVTVNLPISMVEKALPLLADHHLDHGRIHFEEHMDASLADLRELWSEVRASPDMTFVTVEEEDESVRVWKEKGYVYVRVRDDDGEETVDVQLPVQVVDALLSGEGEELNLEAAMAALVEHGEGRLVEVRDRSDHVRVWVDRTAAAAAPAE